MTKEPFNRQQAAEEHLSRSADAIRALFSEPTPTEFDHQLFGYQFAALQSGGDIQFHPLEWQDAHPQIRKLITTRLKLLGYRFEPVGKCWVQAYKPMIT